MVGPWSMSGRRRSVVFLRRINTTRPVKTHTELPSSKMEIPYSGDCFKNSDAFPERSKSASIWSPSERDRLECVCGRNLAEKRYSRKENAAPLVVRNPVHLRKLEEPIERKREYWSDNLLYIMRREGLIPDNCPVVMDRPTPEEPYRLSAHVVRLLEQEPQLYIAKSSIKIPSFDSVDSDRSMSSFADAKRSKSPFPFSRAEHRATENSDLCAESSRYSSHTSFDGDQDLSSSSYTDMERSRKPHSFSTISEARSRRSLCGQKRHYSTSSAEKHAEDSLRDRV
ncbi:uncharacterized protein LOC100907951 [Galendromus occidentalis]|uniref:Uncharacterized protein LOC100907951 n=1 Tax=Galendromus occidentalis TaxID=34638 RepID=A0AAJ7PA39_9ACAR|nr:uncharacterized protein LOC100907951 [Galendromus occidentalis]